MSRNNVRKSLIAFGFVCAAMYFGPRAYQKFNGRSEEKDIIDQSTLKYIRATDEVFCTPYSQTSVQNSGRVDLEIAFSEVDRVGVFVTKIAGVTSTAKKIWFDDFNDTVHVKTIYPDGKRYISESYILGVGDQLRSDYTDKLNSMKYDCDAVRANIKKAGRSTSNRVIFFDGADVPNVSAEFERLDAATKPKQAIYTVSFPNP